MISPGIGVPRFTERVYREACCGTDSKGFSGNKGSSSVQTELFLRCYGCVFVPQRVVVLSLNATVNQRKTTISCELIFLPAYVKVIIGEKRLLK